MKVTDSAFKHDVSEKSIRHAWENAIRFVEYEYHGEERLLAIDPDPYGTLLELVAVPAGEPARIIHSARLRAKFYDYLR